MTRCIGCRSARMLGTLVVAFLSAVPAVTRAGGGHMHGYSGSEESPASSGTVILASDAIVNLGIRSVVVTAVPLADGPTVYGRTAILPGGDVVLAAPSAGSLSRIVASPGTAVRRGDPVLVFSPLQVGAGQVTLTSPFDGVVGDVQGKLGEGREAGSPLGVVYDPRKIGFVAALPRPAAEIGVVVGMPALVSVGTNGETFNGTVTQVTLGHGPGGGLNGVVTVALEVPGGAPPSGIPGAAVLVRRTAASGIELPRAAVVGELGRVAVFVRRGNRFERRSVTLGRTSGVNVEIKTGLIAGEEVVTEGSYPLQYARSDDLSALASGSNGGVPVRLTSERGEIVFGELKLHDDKGDLELWLTKDGSGREPHRLPSSTVIALESRDPARSVRLAVRDAIDNQDESGVGHLVDGRADYFIFPGDSGADATWLQGSEFVGEVRLSCETDGARFNSGWVTLVPHHHGAAHPHGDTDQAHAAHSHSDDHGDHSHGAHDHHH